MAAGLDVRLEHVVRRVDWSHGGVVVSTDRRDFTGARTVVTVPIGVLKSSEFVFDPPIPEPVSGALDRLEMNHFEKIFLRFTVRFWGDDPATVTAALKSGHRAAERILSRSVAFDEFL